MKMNKMLTLAVLTLSSFGLAACGNNNADSGSGSKSGGKIEVITREEGSGTRGAFTEITGILKKMVTKKLIILLNLQSFKTVLKVLSQQFLVTKML